jgi:hypothetical protein
MFARSLHRTTLVALLLLIGCGQHFSLPPQPEPGRIPTPGSYNLDNVWSIPSPTDLVVRGSYLYVIEEQQRLEVYLRNQSTPRHPGFIDRFEGLVRPVQVCVAKRDSTFVFVADAGDMMVKRFYFRGGLPTFSFIDSSWVEFSGLAADNELNVYVSDAARDTIYKYDAMGNPVRLISDYGTGYGFVIDPHGLSYSDGAVWVADTGRNRVQRLRADSTNTAFDGEPIGTDFELDEPTDVVTDPAGDFVFVNDVPNNHVLRFVANGGFRDTVYAHTKRETAIDPPLEAPRFVAADDSLVFLPDSTNDRILILRLATQ